MSDIDTKMPDWVIRDGSGQARCRRCGAWCPKEYCGRQCVNCRTDRLGIAARVLAGIASRRNTPTEHDAVGENGMMHPQDAATNAIMYADALIDAIGPVWNGEAGDG